MPYLGSGPVSGSFPVDTFNGDGSTTQFTLSQAPGSAGAIDVGIDGAYQIPGISYSVSGTTLTFTAAPPSGTNNICAVHKGVTLDIGTPADGTVSPAKTTGMQNVIQIQFTENRSYGSLGTTVMPYDDSIPQNTEGNEFITVSITPTDASNILIIEYIGYTSHTVNFAHAAALFQDSTADALAVAQSVESNGANYMLPIVLRHKMVAGTTSATTFKIRVGGPSAGTVYSNGTSAARRFGGVSASHLMVTEYKA